MPCGITGERAARARSELVRPEVCHGRSDYVHSVTTHPDMSYVSTFVGVGGCPRASYEYHQAPVDGSYENDMLDTILQEMSEELRRHRTTECWLVYKNEARRDYIVKHVKSMYGALHNILTTIKVEQRGYTPAQLTSAKHNDMSYEERLAFMLANRTEAGRITVRMTWFD